MPNDWADLKGREIAADYASAFDDTAAGECEELAADIAAALRLAYEQGGRDATSEPSK